MSRSFSLDTITWSGQYGHQKFYVLLFIPASGHKDTFDFDIGSARTAGKPKFLCDTVRDVPRSIEAITGAVKKALGVET